MPDFSSLDFRDGTFYEVIGKMEEVTYNVMENRHAIAFNIMSYIENEFANMPLKLFSVGGAEPTTENFASGAYPFLTTSYVAIRADETVDSPARDLYDWVGSDESYQLIEWQSTLTVVFSDSVVIRTRDNIIENNGNLKETIYSLDRQTLRREQLYDFTIDEIGYLRNGIFALSGKIFNTPKYVEYFGAQDWYKGTTKNDDAVYERFNDYQKKNLSLILGYEKELLRALLKS